MLFPISRRQLFNFCWPYAENKPTMGNSVIFYTSMNETNQYK